MTVVYDAGALVAADRSDRNLWAEHRARLELGIVPITTAPVVAQVSRSGRQAQLRRFLRGCQLVSFGAEEANEVGALAGRCGVDDVIDVHVVTVANRVGASVMTSDAQDLSRVASELTPPVPIIAR